MFTSSVRNAAVPRIESPPLPHEHGAWVMLYVPMMLGFAVARPSGWAQVLLLALTVSGAFLARHPADLLLRGKGDSGSPFWMATYAAVALAGVVPLLVVWHTSALVFVAAIAGALFGVHAVLLEWPGKRRWDRSVVGEFLAVSGLTLTAPAAVVVARGTITPDAWMLWGACALFFGGSVFHVKMLLSGAKHKGAMRATDRWKLGRSNVLYHVAVAGLVFYLARVSVGPWLVWVAYLPVVLRAFWGAVKLSRKPPPLVQVGMLESAYAVWYSVWFGAAMLTR